jgi:DNA-binding NarL/FixJ family response regulator
MAQLSLQECLIMLLLAEGKTKMGFAVQLRLIDKTVETNPSNTFNKLHIMQHIEVVAWFMKESRSGFTTRTT